MSTPNVAPQSWVVRNCKSAVECINKEKHAYANGRGNEKVPYLHTTNDDDLGIFSGDLCFQVIDGAGSEHPRAQVPIARALLNGLTAPYNALTPKAQIEGVHKRIRLIGVARDDFPHRPAHDGNTADPVVVIHGMVTIPNSSAVVIQPGDKIFATEPNPTRSSQHSVHNKGTTSHMRRVLETTPLRYDSRLLSDHDGKAVMTYEPLAELAATATHNMLLRCSRPILDAYCRPIWELMKRNIPAGEFRMGVAGAAGVAPIPLNIIAAVLGANDAYALDSWERVAGWIAERDQPVRELPLFMKAMAVIEMFGNRSIFEALTVYQQAEDLNYTTIRGGRDVAAKTEAVLKEEVRRLTDPMRMSLAGLSEVPAGANGVIFTEKVIAGIERISTVAMSNIESRYVGIAKGYAQPGQMFDCKVDIGPSTVSTQLGGYRP